MYYTYDVLDKALEHLFDQNLPVQNKIAFVDQKDHYSLTTPLPGAKREDVKVIVTGNQLEISYNPSQKNIYAPSFSKYWKLNEVDFDSITADLKDGLLTVIVPKQKSQKQGTRTIAVN